MPTPVVHTRLVPPMSRMSPADGVEAAAKASPLHAKYAERVDAESAREQLAARLAEAGATAASDAEAPKPATEPDARKKQQEAAGAAAGGVEQLGEFLTSRKGQRLQKQVMRGVFGMLRKKL